jgi:hypothetical protein
MRSTRIVLLALAASLIGTPAALAAGKPKVHSLTLTTGTIEMGSVDNGTPGIGKGDMWLRSAELLDKAGKAAGHFQTVCTVTDESIEGGSRGVCTSVAEIHGRGQIVASGSNLLLPNPGGPNLQVLPGVHTDFAIVGGTDSFFGIRGQLHGTRTATGTTLRFRYR